MKTFLSQDRRSLYLQAGLLALLTLISRVPLLSSPYFVDGPRHVAAISSGAIFIQAPGYFLFGALGRVLDLLLNISPAAALSLMNVSFSVAGVVVFRLLTAEIFPGTLGFVLSAFYAFSDVVWFASDVQSSYAGMTFFAPLLIYVLVVRQNFWLGTLVWALMTGLRPSDGVFAFPFLAYMAYKKPAKQIAVAVLLALPIIAIWYVPTIRHFGGSITSPLHAASGQVGYVAQGVLVKGAPYYGAGEVVHFLFGCLDAWNVLIPFLFLGLLASRTWRKLCLLWMLPGVLFFTLYFFSDPVYLCYMIAPGVILAGLGLRKFFPHRAVMIVSVAIFISATQMLVARPITPRNVPEAVINSYSLQYSGWALKHSYYKRLRTSIDDLHNGRPVNSASE